MGERSRGIPIALTLVAISALAVSFFSASKLRKTERQVRTLKVETQQLSQTNRTLEDRLRQAREQAHREAAVSQELLAALAQQQAAAEAIPDEEPKARVAQSNVQSR